MAIISSGQITIIDMYDAPSLNAWLSSSKGDSQLYNNTTAAWNPDYTTNAQELKLHLTRAGSATDLLTDDKVTDIKWTKSVGSTTTDITTTSDTAGEYLSGDKKEILNIQENIKKEHSAVTYTVTGTWNDTDGSGLPVQFSAKITLTLIQLAKASIIIDTTTPKGYFFKNNTPAQLTIEAFLYKDGDVSEDDKTVKWFRSDESVNTKTSDGYDESGGMGWAKIEATSADKGGEYSNVAFDTSVTTKTPILTILPGNVVNGQTYKVILEDNVGDGAVLTDYITIMDYDDPIQVVIESTGGEVLKNGLGETNLTARLYRNGEEIDTSGTYQYSWTKRENNNLVSGWTRTDKTIRVDTDDINGKSVFRVEVKE